MRRQTSSFADARVRSCGGIHQAWWRQTLSLTEAGLWLSSSFVGLIQLSFLVVVSSLGVVPSCVFVSSPCVFVSSPCVFVPCSCIFVSSSCVFIASPCAFVFANLLWFSFVVFIVEICLLPIFLFVFLAIS